MPQYDIRALERALEQAEEADAETHKLLNNLGLGHSAAGRPRAALRAHRKEKQACKRLAAAPGAPPSRLVDLAIAYRRCGDAMLKVDALEVGGGDGAELITERVDIVRRAREQHARALRMAAAAAEAGAEAAAAEVQAASAAMSQSALIVALDTKERADFEEVAGLCGRAAALAQQLTDAQVGGRRARSSMLISAAVNLGIAMSGLGERASAKALFEAIAVRSKDSGDTLNLMRGIANLAEEIGEDGDWPLCLEYVDEWVALAKDKRDDGEVGEALRKRGAVLFELSRFEEARVALDRAALLGRDESAREEARRNLALVQKEIEDLKSAREIFEKAIAKISSVSGANGDVVAEAVARLDAGDAAFRLRQDDEVLEHLRRYFTLAEEYGCVPGATNVTPVRHASAVANMAETLWRQKNFSEAVEWGMKELAAYKDDVAGQAQAWCNIGIYLDDDGKYEAAKEALATSMRLADEAGDVHLRLQAQRNLSVIVENQLEKNAVDAAALLPGDGGVNTGGLADGDLPVAPGLPPSQYRLRDDESNRSAGEEHSIVIDSGGNGKNTAVRGGSDSRDVASRRSRAVANSDAVSRHGIAGNTAANHASTTASRSAADRNSVGARRVLDLVALFRKQCGKAFQQSGVEITPRSILLDRLRPLSAKLIACEEGGVVDIDFSSTFLCDDEVPAVFRTLTALPIYDPQLNLNLSLNPFLTTPSIRWLTSVSSVNGPPRALPAMVSLDLSGTGVDASCLSMLARALCPLGTLPHVKSLALGKNALGRQPLVAADAVARLLLQNSQLQSLDLSLNLLSHGFLVRLVECLEKLSTERRKNLPSLPPLSVMSLDLRLNNRRQPTALLEVSDTGLSTAGAPADLLRRLVAAVPSLRSIDLRSCGAGDLARKPIVQLRKNLLEPRSVFLCGGADVDDSVEIIVVSPGVHDPIGDGFESQN